MKTLLTIAFTAISILCFAQTDIIEMRSRGASLTKYERSSKSNSFDHVASNFGAIPMQMITTAVLDSVKHESDSVIVMYTRECNSLVRLRYGRVEEPTPSELNSPQESPWKPGADTILNHPLFHNKHSLDSIKTIIDRDYNFVLPADSVKFIGYDNANSQVNQEIVEPVKIKNEVKNSFGWELFFMLISPVLIVFGFRRYLIPHSEE